MSDTVLTLTGIEAACVYAAVSNEKELLEDEIESDVLTQSEKEEAEKSIEVCKTVLSKLSSQPGVTYSVE